MKLSNKKIGILIESDYYEHEIWYYKFRFPEAGIKKENLHFMSRLWGNSSLTFHGHEYKAPFTCDKSFESITDEELKDYAAIIVPSGIVSDRLRYSQDVKEISPAAKFLERVLDNKSILKGIICHGLWLLAPIRHKVEGRKMTCNNNLVHDAIAYGIDYQDEDVYVDDDIVSARTGDHCYLLASQILHLLNSGT